MKRDNSSPKLNNNPDIQAEEGEDDSVLYDNNPMGDNKEINNNTRWRYTRRGRLLNRPTSSISTASSHNTKVFQYTQITIIVYCEKKKSPNQIKLCSVDARDKVSSICLPLAFLIYGRQAHRCPVMR